MSAQVSVADGRESRGRHSMLQRWARAAVRKQLDGMTHGQLTITDPLGQWSVGQPGELDAKLTVHDCRFYADVLLEGGLGAADAWIGGVWDTDDLTGALRLMVRNMDRIDALEGGFASLANGVARVRHWMNRNSPDGSSRNIHAHYDIGNDLFALFLDESMTYSSGIYPSEASTLAQAQYEKLDRICRKLALTAADHVVEIGTGWGSFAIHAASNYGCKVTTTTISAEQHALAVERVRKSGLDDRIEVLLCDYRELQGQFDKLVSIEMVEAVGDAFLPEYFGACSRLLKPSGSMVIQAINMPDQRYQRYLKTADFIQTTVFPGSCCPAITAMLGAVREASDLRLAHLEDIGLHYATTLRQWRERFDARESEVDALGYSPEFKRMWRYYLSYCEAGFAERYTATVQMLLEKPACRAPSVLGLLAQPAQD
jgi:cyclopropane-fatty-acyl-phospholipid synthase